MTRRQPLRGAAAGTIIAILAVLVLAADQFVKYLTITHLPEQKVVPVLGDFFRLYYIRNAGAAFSIGEGATWIFTIALAVVACVIVWKSFTTRSRLWAVVLGALLGGVLGNLSDRLFRAPGFAVGHVVDMISMPWMMPAIFNVADTFIVTGMISIALLIIVGLRLDGTRERDVKAGEAVAAQEQGAAPEAPETVTASRPATARESAPSEPSEDAPSRPSDGA